MKKAVLSIALLAVPSAALAHPGHESAGLLHGLVHPLTGADHLVAMIAVGLLALSVGGRAVIAVPASFIAMMIVGALLGHGQTSLPSIEIVIVASGAIIAGLALFGARLPLVVATTIVALFGAFHGYAHGAEMAPGDAAAFYGVGLILATAMVQAATIGIIGHVARRPGLARFGVLRTAAAIMMTAGLAVMAAS